MRAYAEKEGWDILKVFRWDGYSRWESDPIAALEDFAEQGRYEYHELRRMWRERGFDVLMLYTHSRAGRSFTMQSWVVENVIRHDGEVFRIHGGWINKKDYAFQIGMGGVLSTNDIDRLVEQRDQAMNVRASKGLPTSSTIPFSHLVRRDEYGRIIGALQVNEDYRRLWDDVAVLLLEGASLSGMGLTLYQRYGHVAASGRPHGMLAIRMILYTPIFWGHSARFFNNGFDRKNGAWVYDDSLSPPEGVLLYRHTHEAVYTGEQADRIRLELDRRGYVKGRANASATNRFTGLFICGGCTYSMGYSNNHGITWLACSARLDRISRLPTCDEVGGIKVVYAQAFIERMLEHAVEKGEVGSFFDNGEVVREPIIPRAQQLQVEIDTLTEQATWTHEQAKLHKELRKVYETDLDKINARLVILNANLENSRYFETRVTQEQVEEKRVIEELRELTLETFWQRSDREVNQTLHRFFGNRRLAVSKKAIINRFVNKPPHFRS